MVLRKPCIIACLTFFMLSNVVWAQSAASRKAMRHLDDGRWQKAHEILAEALEKNNINSGVKFGLSLLYTVDSLSIYNIDTAYQFILTSLLDFANTELKEKERLIKSGVDSLRLISQKMRLDSLAFLRAKDQNVVESYENFLRRFDTAKEASEATRLRNQAAFLVAEQEGSYRSYKNFLDTYPDAEEWEIAQAKYEKLYYLSATEAGSLASYLSFLKAHPNTPYRSQAEEQILKLSTLDNEVSSYQQFIENYPGSKVKPMAIGYLYHLSKGNPFSDKLSSQWITDSLSHVMTLDSGQWIIYAENGKPRIMNERGIDKTPIALKEVGREAWCKTITSDYLWWRDQGLQITGRNGRLIWQGEADSVENLGAGLLRLKKGELVSVVHKSGATVLPFRYQEVRLILGAFLAIKEKNSWGIASFHGEVLVSPQYDEIRELGAFILLAEHQTWGVTNKASVVDAIHASLKVVDRVEDFELLNTGHLWIGLGEKEGILDQDLSMLIPWQEQTIQPKNDQFLVRSGRGVQVYDLQWQLVMDLKGENYQVNDRWIAMADGKMWKLHHLDSIEFAEQFDRVELFGNHMAVGQRGDSSWLVLTGKKDLYLDKQQAQLKLVRSSNSSEYILLQTGNRKTLYNPEGEMVLNANQGSVAAVGKEYLTLTIGNRKGLYHASGERLLPVKYDAFGNYNHGEVSVLRRKKFGLFNAASGIDIPPVYDRRLTDYNRDVRIAYQGQGYGLIDKNNKALTEFSFNEIHFWNDSIARVRNNGRWALYNFVNGGFEYENIWTFETFQSNDETLAIFSTTSGFGVIGNQRGLIVPPVFSEIRNIGVASAPVYVAERYLAEIDYYVVAYYNSRGEVIKKQSFEPSDYEKILCKY